MAVRALAYPVPDRQNDERTPGEADVRDGQGPERSIDPDAHSRERWPGGGVGAIAGHKSPTSHVVVPLGYQRVGTSPQPLGIEVGIDEHALDTLRRASGRAQP